MGSSSKKYKEKESRKRRHRSRSASEEREAPKEKKHRHRKHHKDRKREKATKTYEYESDDSDVVEVISDDANGETPPPPKLNQSPEHSKQSSDSLSIDETNKLRAKLGLKPLQRSNTGNDGKIKDDLGEFYHKPAASLSAKAKSEKLKQKLSEHREKRHVEHKLSKVKLLGESDSEDDAESWVERNRRVQNERKEAEKRAKMLEELDAQFGVGEIIESEQREKRRQKYTDKNLLGLTVDHDVNSFSEGKTVILTLKDQGVLDEDDDVLVNVNMLDDERYKKSVENKKKKNPYNAYDIEDLDEFGNPKPKSLLYKYDEEIEGEKRENFKIGHDNAVERKQAIVESVRQKLANKRLESLSNQLTLASEYYNEEELAKFKKPKKKMKKLRSKGKILTADDLEQQINKTGIEEIGTRRPKFKEDHFNIDDMPSVDIPTDMKLEENDDDLEKALHKARKVKQKSNVIADLIGSTPVKPEPEEENGDNGAIVLNATAEFCRSLGDIPTYGKAGNREEIEDLMDYDKDIKEDAYTEDQEMEESSGWNSVDPNVKPEVVHIDPEVPILDEEPDVSAGVGAALKLAMSKGYLEKEDNNRPSNSRLAHLQAKHYSIEDKSYGEEGDRVNNRRERYSGPIQDFREKDGFKPNVKLEYIDDEGHILNSKEAFRYLSHKFHGKGPGKNKIEKRIKKNVQEGLMKKMSSTDTPLGTLNMLQAKQKELQSPYIVLSGSKNTHSATVISKARR